MQNGQLEVGDIFDVNTPNIQPAEAQRRQAVIEHLNNRLKKGSLWIGVIAGSTVSLIAAIVAIIIAFKVPGPIGPQGPLGPEGPVGPAITYEALSGAVEKAVAKETEKFSKGTSKAEVMQLIRESLPPAFNDAALKAETDTLRKELADVRKELAEVEKTKSVPVPSVSEASSSPKTIGVQPVTLMEEQQLSREVTDKDVKWIPYKGYMLPIWKVNERGVTSPTEPNLQKPKGYESWEWAVIPGKSANWALARVR